MTRTRTNGDTAASSTTVATDGGTAETEEGTTTSYDESSVGEESNGVHYRTRPTIKPALVWVGLTLLVGGTIAIALFQNVLGLEDPELASILGWVAVFVVVIVVARFLVRIYVLTRTQYTVTDDMVHYEFSLWFRRQKLDVPITQVRGCELDQNRVQRVFDVGTVSVLTGGTNASLGYVEFHNVPHPARVQEAIRERTQELSRPASGK